jgi:hypothetical protein
VSRRRLPVASVEAPHGMPEPQFADAVVDARSPAKEVALPAGATVPVRGGPFEKVGLTPRQGWQQAITYWQREAALPAPLAECVADALQACLADPGHVARRLGLAAKRGRRRKGVGAVPPEGGPEHEKREVRSRSDDDAIPASVPPGEGAAEALAPWMFDRAQDRLLPHRGGWRSGPDTGAVLEIRDLGYPLREGTRSALGARGGDDPSGMLG